MPFQGYFNKLRYFKSTNYKNKKSDPSGFSGTLYTANRTLGQHAKYQKYAAATSIIVMFIFIAIERNKIT